jgi:hypothetical protein
MSTNRATRDGKCAEIATGFEVGRITWRQLEGDPGSVPTLLRRYLRDAVP